MQHDTVIWNIISPSNGGFCTFRRKLPNCPTRFCKNQYNVLGICHPLACPLANSRYATIREHKGECYLLMKTIERAHLPSRQWEHVKLSKDYMTALKQIDQHLMWWPKWNIHKCKLRLTRIHQYLIRARKLALSIQPKLVRIWKPFERQQEIREQKAEIAAKITNVVKAELLERLHEGVYEGIYNFPLQQYNEIMEEKGVSEDSEPDNEQENEKEEDNKPSTNKQKKQEKAKPDFVEDFEESEYEDLEIEDIDVDDKEKEKEYELEYEYELNDTTPKQLQTQTHGQFIKHIKSNKKNKNNRKKKN